MSPLRFLLNWPHLLMGLPFLGGEYPPVAPSLQPLSSQGSREGLSGCLLLLPSRFSRVRLCATPEMAPPNPNPQAFVLKPSCGSSASVGVGMGMGVGWGWGWGLGILQVDLLLAVWLKLINTKLLLYSWFFRPGDTKMNKILAQVLGSLHPVREGTEAHVGTLSDVKC